MAAASLFATLQSLGATGVGTLLFGATGVALALLATLASRLDWCTCEADDDQPNETLFSRESNRDDESSANDAINADNASSTTESSSNEYKDLRVVEYKEKLETIENFSNCSECNKPSVCEANLKKIRETVAENVPAIMSLFKTLGFCMAMKIQPSEF